MSILQRNRWKKSSCSENANFLWHGKYWQMNMELFETLLEKSWKFSPAICILVIIISQSKGTKYSQQTQVKVKLSADLLFHIISVHYRWVNQSGNTEIIFLARLCTSKTECRWMLRATTRSQYYLDMISGPQGVGRYCEVAPGKIVPPLSEQWSLTYLSGSILYRWTKWVVTYYIHCIQGSYSHY